MAYPKKKAAKRSPSPRKRKAPAKKVIGAEAMEENMAYFLWVFCGIAGSQAVYDEVEAVRGSYQGLKPAARKELRTIAARAVLAFQSAHGLVRRQRLESGKSRR